MYASVAIFPLSKYAWLLRESGAMRTPPSHKSILNLDEADICAIYHWPAYSSLPKGLVLPAKFLDRVRCWPTIADLDIYCDQVDVNNAELPEEVTDLLVIGVEWGSESSGNTSIECSSNGVRQSS